MSLKILIIEDHEIVGKVMLALLRTTGYEPTLAVNGEEGVQCFEINRYDLVLMDIGLPDISGYIASKRIREKERASPGYVKDIPIIALTAHADRDVAQRLHPVTDLDDWITAWYEKPLTMQGLENLLERFHLIPTSVN